MWRKVVYAALVVAFFAVIVSFYLSRKKALGLAAIALLESAHRPNIQRHLDSVEELKKDLVTNAEAIKRAEFEVEKARLDLTQTYSSVGLSADEVAARLATLRL